MYDSVIMFYIKSSRPCTIQYMCIFIYFQQSPAQYTLIEQDAIKLADQMKAEYWAVSALSGKFLTRDDTIE